MKTIKCGKNKIVLPAPLCTTYTQMLMAVHVYMNTNLCVLILFLPFNEFPLTPQSAGFYLLTVSLGLHFICCLLLFPCAVWLSLGGNNRWDLGIKPAWLITGLQLFGNSCDQTAGIFKKLKAAFSWLPVWRVPLREVSKTYIVQADNILPIAVH